MDENEKDKHYELIMDDSFDMNQLQPILLSDSELDEEFDGDQKTPASTNLDSSNSDSDLIKLLLVDKEYLDMDDNAPLPSAETPVVSRKFHLHKIPSEACSPRTQGVHTPDCNPWSLGDVGYEVGRI